MIRKVINSHDIHVGGQQLRIVHKNELAGSVEGFNNIDLMLNEPRGSKYVNLFVYSTDDKMIELEIHTNSTFDNRDILQKSFIRSLLERGNIIQQEEYAIRTQEDTYTYEHNSLGIENIHEVESEDGVYAVNGKSVHVEEVKFELTVENVAQIKKFVEAYEEFEGYLLLVDQDRHVTVNEEKVILSYTVGEAVSVLNRIYEQDEITALNGGEVEVVNGQYAFEHRLISNSQFYIDDSDIYSKGFVIR